MSRLFPDRCDHPGFVSQTYRLRPGTISVLPSGSQVEHFAGTYWTEPRCVACGAPERPLPPATVESGPRVGLWVAVGLWAGGCVLFGLHVVGLV